MGGADGAAKGSKHQLVLLLHLLGRDERILIDRLVLAIHRARGGAAVRQCDARLLTPERTLVR